MSMFPEEYREKVRCSKCGEECYKLCYVGERVVCVDCFQRECDKRSGLKKVSL